MITFHSLQISFKTDNYFHVLRTAKMVLSVMFTAVAEVQQLLSHPVMIINNM